VSLTSSVAPSGERRRCCGELKDAEVPRPSTSAPAPLPASVATAPAGVTTRTRLPSAAYISPAAGSCARENRLVKRAAPPAPSANPALPPASVAALRLANRTRRRALPLSATSTTASPPSVAAMASRGAENWGAGPSAKPAAGLALREAVV